MDIDKYFYDNFLIANIFVVAVSIIVGFLIGKSMPKGFVFSIAGFILALLTPIVAGSLFFLVHGLLQHVDWKQISEVAADQSGGFLFLLYEVGLSFSIFGLVAAPIAFVFGRLRKAR